ncbi:MAG: leucine-rich repeat domain-containing protein [Alphaproteobacteria bacterium]|nr:leucine-rich repeat domain-containing protein [Alphaproteobacteria bacterium]
MKKMVYILSLALSFNTYASNDCGDDLNINCWDCGKTQSDNCTARLDGTKLTITSTNNGQMKDYDYFSNINSPWGTNITSANISGVSSVGNYAFFLASNLSDVNLSDSVKILGDSSFDYSSNLKNITLPRNLETMGRYVFSSSGLEQIIIPDNVSTIGYGAFMASPGGLTNLRSIVIGNGVNSIDVGAFENINTEAKIYCQDTEENRCFNLLNQNNNSELSRLIKFEKDGDLYKTTSDGKYYASIDLMAGGKQKACDSKEHCLEILMADMKGQAFVAHGKFYQSIEDYTKGNSIKHLIYTIDEANRIAGDKNRVSITYK